MNKIPKNGKISPGGNAATSATALLVSYALPGIGFTVFIFFAVIVMGLIMRAVGNLIRFGPRGQAGEIVIDPICGVSVITSKSLETRYKGNTKSGSGGI